MAEDVSKKAVVLILLLTIVVSVLSTMVIWGKMTTPPRITTGTGEVRINILGPEPEPIVGPPMDGEVAINIKPQAIE